MLRIVASRMAGAVAAGALLWIGRKLGVTFSADETDAVAAAMLTVVLAGYSLMHRWVSAKTNPVDVATPKATTPKGARKVEGVTRAPRKKAPAKQRTAPAAPAAPTKPKPAKATAKATRAPKPPPGPRDVPPFATAEGEIVAGALRRGGRRTTDRVVLDITPPTSTPAA